MSKYNELLHPRVASGPKGGWWTPSGAKAEAAARKAAGLDYGSMASKIREDNGFSVNLEGKSPTHGYMVSPDKGTETKIDIKDLQDQDIGDYVMGHLQGLMRKNYYAGGWLSGGKAVLDVSKNVFSKTEAIELAIHGQQDEVYNYDGPSLKRGVDYDW
jgi:hypothetical protein